MKKLKLLSLFLLLTTLGFSQSFNNLTVRNKLTVDSEIELNDSSSTIISSDGDTLATLYSVKNLVEDSIDNISVAQIAVDSLISRNDSIYLKSALTGSYLRLDTIYANEYVGASTATGSAGELQYTDGAGNLQASSKMVFKGDSLTTQKIVTDTLIVDSLVGIGTRHPLSALNINKGYGTISQGITLGSTSIGLYPFSSTQLNITFGGANQWKFLASAIRGQRSYSGGLFNTTSSAVIPAVGIADDENCGLGRAGADQLSIIAGGKEIARAKEATTEQFIINPQGDLTGTAAAPSLAFGDGNTGFYELVDNVLGFGTGGNLRMQLSSTALQGVGSNYFLLDLGIASATNPLYAFRGDENTGLGRNAADQPSLIAGGIEAMRLTKDDVTIDSSLYVGGNVGIGIITPSENLEVRGDVYFNTGGDYFFRTDFDNDEIDLSARLVKLGDFDAAANETYMTINDSNKEFIFTTGGVEAMRLTEDTVFVDSVLKAGKIVAPGNNYEVIFNNNDILGASSNLTWNDTTLALGSEVGTGNIFIGLDAGADHASGTGSTYIGYEAGANSTNGASNVLIGYRAGKVIAGGDNETIIGSTAGINTTGDNNVFIGAQSGLSNTTGTGNTYIGTESGENATGISNVFIGLRAGQNETDSSKLYIENSNSATPLIYGDFAEDSIIINGDLSVTGNMYFENSHGYIGCQDSTVTLAITQNNWTQITNASDSLLTKVELSNVTYIKGDTIQIVQDGWYDIDATVSFEGNNGETWNFGVAKNGTVQNFHVTKYTGNNNIVVVPIVSHIEFDADDKLTLEIKNISDNDDCIITGVQLRLTWVHL